MEVTNTSAAAANNVNNNPMQIMKEFLKQSTHEIFGNSRGSGSKSVADSAPNFQVEHEMHSIKNLSPDVIKIAEYGE